MRLIKNSLSKIIMAVLVFGAAAVPLAGAEDIPAVDLDKKIGAMIMIGFQGKSPEEDWPQKLFQQIKDGQVGGVIFFSYNIKWPRQFRPLMEYLHLATTEPVFFALDQEGGRVERLSSKNDYKSFLSAKAVAKKYSPAAAYDYYAPMAKMIREAGFNLDLAPVVDLDYRMPCPVIGGMERSYSTEPKPITLYARAMIRALHTQGVLSCIKHFPGHGSLSADTHRDLGDITQTWKRRELQPFLQALEGPDAADMVMVGHLINRGYDNRYPATLSPVIIKKFLREQAQYDGVVISDDLHMGAILKNYGLEESVVAAINAGVDILIFSNNPSAAKGFDNFQPDPDLPLKVRDIVTRAVADGRIALSQIEQAYERIERVRQKLLLLESELKAREQAAADVLPGNDWRLRKINNIEILTGGNK